MFWQTFTQTLYNLAAYPQYVGSLREEVTTVIRKQGWTKEATTLMGKVDSFLAETRGLEGVLTWMYAIAYCYREADRLRPSFSRRNSPICSGACLPPR
ncbi:hypothetical protein F5141DRAFT_462380 [Pisolithus sp. B1]|nr:hypothetical protein F5141DRAFT_462380 [Pisolithus sp. B1]